MSKQSKILFFSFGDTKNWEVLEFVQVTEVAAKVAEQQQQDNLSNCRKRLEGHQSINDNLLCC